RRLHSRHPQQAFARRAAEALTREGRRGRGHDTPLAGRPACVLGQRGDTGPPAGEEPDAEDAGHDVPSSTSAALQPPKPSEVLRLTRGRAARATPRTSRSHAGSASSYPAVPGTTPSREASRHMIASSVAAAPIVWPSAPLIELTGTAPARAPSTRRSTAVSILSFSGVPVPCALTKSTASPPTPAAASAPRT